MRTGPGTRYPSPGYTIVPACRLRSSTRYDLWRKIRDSEGTTGWVHKTMLDGKRNAMIHGKQAQVLRIDPEAKTKPMLKAEPIVVGSLLECQPEWCHIPGVRAQRLGEKKYLWGVYPEEVFD